MATETASRPRGRPSRLKITIKATLRVSAQDVDELLKNIALAGQSNINPDLVEDLRELRSAFRSHGQWRD